MRSQLIVALTVSTLAMCRIPAQTNASSERFRDLRPCDTPGVEGKAYCGQFETREVHSNPASRTIRLNVVVLPATTDSVLNDPLTFLAGGGVVPATRYAGFLARSFPGLRRNRDVLLVDQRGTWNSNPLTCDPPPSTISACAESWKDRADVDAYTTTAAVKDLDDVRAWLKYDRLNIYGVSYGTKVAQVYLKTYPARVRATVLYGVVPLSLPFQLELARSSQESLQKVFAQCEAAADCNVMFPRLKAEFDSLLVRLSRAPVQLDGPPPLTITDRMVRNVVQGMLNSARSMERIPLLIHQAYGGDYSAIVRSVLGDGPPPPPPAPRGVFLSLLCNESLNKVSPDEIEPATRGSFFGADPVRAQIAQCAAWPRVTLPADFWSPAHADVPVLAISGTLDPITPPRYADTVVAHLGRARHIVVPSRSHGDVDPCITSLFEAFLIRGSDENLDTSCAAVPAPLRFVNR